MLYTHTTIKHIEKNRYEEHAFQKCCQIEQDNPVIKDKFELVNINVPNNNYSSLLMLYIQQYSS